MATEQRLVLYQNGPKGAFSSARVDNLDEINALLTAGWRVVKVAPTSSPATDVGAEWRIFALVVLDRTVLEPPPG